MRAETAVASLSKITAFNEVSNAEMVNTSVML